MQASSEASNATYPKIPSASVPQECASQVELRIHCKNLINKDTTSKSDPCAVLYIYEQDRWNELARTENIKNCLDPQFATPLSVKYYFEVVQKIKIAVYDVDNKTETLSDDDFLGQFECTLGQLVSNSPLTKKLLNKKGKEFEKSLITVTAEELSNKNELVQLSICAKKLDNKDFLGKSDPFLEFSKKNTDGSSQVVHRTEVIKNNLNPTWHPFSLTTQALCNNDKSKPIQIDCYDWDSDGSHDLIGSCTMTLAEMMEAGSGSEVEKPCVNPKKKKANSGHIIVQTCKVTVIPSFLNYVMGGMQINFTVGIDFTGSNGDPADPQSLHYISPDAPNQYMQAIQAVGSVCQDYDTDKFFPALGFGAKIPPHMELSHEFAVNFNFQNPFCAVEKNLTFLSHLKVITCSLDGLLKRSLSLSRWSSQTLSLSMVFSNALSLSLDGLLKLSLSLDGLLNFALSLSGLLVFSNSLSLSLDGLLKLSLSLDGLLKRSLSLSLDGLQTLSLSLDGLLKRSLSLSLDGLLALSLSLS
ncbi:Copine-7,Copine-3,Copine-8,Copine-9,Copine-2,Copine-6,Copine-5,Copine-4,Copine-1 [Acanthosepion pharaonis]|uniref:Copine-3 n=1 Tax=Acanthosepion pharaonis TaxID=158019 RepID=A0A812CYX5_ACAPH|nr:Copine-7,Copine-3,Copine-8,Copine-9,Copine-2,Copine-6,Copine-5,Copine-4,Copine-1 [Sepia pharaonis]